MQRDSFDRIIYWIFMIAFLIQCLLTFCILFGPAYSSDNAGDGPTQGPSDPLIAVAQGPPPTVSSGLSTSAYQSDAQSSSAQPAKKSLEE